MSKWKSNSVKIVQISVVMSQSFTVYRFGLGSDGNVYHWVVKKGKWEKDWDIEEDRDE